MRTGRSEKRQTHVHVHDLGDFYVLFVEQTAAEGGQGDLGKKGCYFVQRGDQVVENWSRFWCRPGRWRLSRRYK